MKYCLFRDNSAAHKNDLLKDQCPCIENFIINSTEEEDDDKTTDNGMWKKNKKSKNLKRNRT